VCAKYVARRNSGVEDLDCKRATNDKIRTIPDENKHDEEEESCLLITGMGMGMRMHDYGVADR
jgi:hypothetical protein